MTFSDDLRKFTLKVETRNAAVFSGVVDAAHDSIQNGSPITGSPGQQVDTGNLRASWQKHYESPTEAVISTNAVYAKQEEEGIAASGAPIHQRSQVGGPHSVKLTVAGFQNLVDHVTREVTDT